MDSLTDIIIIVLALAGIGLLSLLIKKFLAGVPFLGTGCGGG